MNTLLKTVFLLCMLFTAGSIAAQDTIQRQTPEKRFAQDVSQGTIKLYILGGIVSAIKKGDTEFQKKYKLTYYDFGCMAPIDLDNYITYNQRVFDFLKANFGSDWRKDINPKVMGFEKWALAN